MTQMDFVTAVSAFQTNASAYAQAALLTNPQYGISRIVGDRGNVGALVLANDWAGLSSYCQTKMADLLAKMAGLAGEQSQINGLYAQLWALKPSFSLYYQSPGANASWIARRATLYADLVTQGTSPANAESLLARLDANGGQNGFNLLKGALDQYPLLLNFAFERHLSLYAYYYHTKSVADYNLIAAVPSAITYSVTSRINSLSNGIKTRQLALYTKINNNDFSGLLSSCGTYSAWVDTKMQAEIIPILSYCYQQRHAPGSSFTSDGRRAMKAGDVFQRAVYSKALFLWVKWMGQWHEEVKDRKELTAKAGSLADTPIEIAGGVISVANLHNHPATYNATDVVAEGVLSNLTITHLTATKVVSTANLANSSGTTILLVLPHIKMDSGGLVNGCYLKVSGNFLEVNPEASNQPALSVARYAMTTLAQTSWNAWLRNQMHTIYEPIPHNLEMMFSAEASTDGAINPAKYSITSGKSHSLKITNKVY
jgi:hypothetical protein